MEKYFIAIENFAMLHGNSLSGEAALDWLGRLENEPLVDYQDVHDQEKVSFEDLRKVFTKKFGAWEDYQFDYVYQIWRTVATKPISRLEKAFEKTFWRDYVSWKKEAIK